MVCIERTLLIISELFHSLVVNTIFSLYNMFAYHIVALYTNVTQSYGITTKSIHDCIRVQLPSTTDDVQRSSTVFSPTIEYNLALYEVRCM